MSRQKTGAARPAANKGGQQKKKSPLPLFIIFGVFAAAVVAGVLLVSSNKSASTPTANAPKKDIWSAERSASLPPGAQPPQSKGNPGAAVTIEEFGDYQCPSCGYLHPVVNKITADYGDRVYLVFRHLPLETIHNNAALAARAAEAAGLQQKFWPMHDLLYEHQKDWSNQPNPRPTFETYAQRIGLDINKFRTDIDSPVVGARIRADVQRAASVGVTGTPTVFVNGILLTSLKEEDIRREIEAALNRKAR